MGASMPHSSSRTSVGTSQHGVSRFGTLSGMHISFHYLCRWQTMLYSTADCALPPAAKLQSNVFGTHYELILDPSVVPFEGSSAMDAAGRPFGKCESLMDVQYKTRLKGFMRPRRYHIAKHLSHCACLLSRVPASSPGHLQWRVQKWPLCRNMAA